MLSQLLPDHPAGVQDPTVPERVARRRLLRPRRAEHRAVWDVALEGYRRGGARMERPLREANHVIRVSRGPPAETGIPCLERRCLAGLT